MNASEMLEKLTELYAKRDLLNLDKKRAIPAEVQTILDEIEAEFAAPLVAVVNEITELEMKIKETVIATGETAKGGALQAVYDKGRTSWDTKTLNGYIKAHPELADCRKQGDPFVSIRKLG